jgi:hypothetical protein
MALRMILTRYLVCPNGSLIGGVCLSATVDGELLAYYYCCYTRFSNLNTMRHFSFQLAAIYRSSRDGSCACCVRMLSSSYFHVILKPTLPQRRAPQVILDYFHEIAVAASHNVKLDSKSTAYVMMHNDRCIDDVLSPPALRYR